jgi:hypothetical protein
MDEDDKFDFHNNAAILIVAAAQRSRLLRDVANALRCSRDIPDGGAGLCLACGVLEELIENFGWHCGHPGYDFYSEGFCVTEYSGVELASYLHVPFALPKNPDDATEFASPNEPANPARSN